MGNMDIYNAHRQAPKEALKTINAGRLKGMSDINPMWRIKALTETFGPCGIGWYYTTDKQWFETCGQETVAFVNISLYIKADGEWSKPISGTGGSKLGTMERSGLYVSDEALKMATTDAISVCCKQLGFAADVYWQNDRSKYSATTEDPKANAQTANKPAQQKQEDDGMTEEEYNNLLALMDQKGIDAKILCGTYKVESLIVLTHAQYENAIARLNKSKDKE